MQPWKNDETYSISTTASILPMPNLSHKPCSSCRACGAAFDCEVVTVGKARTSSSNAASQARQLLQGMRGMHPIVTTTNTVATDASGFFVLLDPLPVRIDEFLQERFDRLGQIARLIECRTCAAKVGFRLLHARYIKENQ